MDLRRRALELLCLADPAAKAAATRALFEGADTLAIDADAALLHAVAHIEFNAISLALDAIWRARPRLPQLDACCCGASAALQLAYRTLGRFRPAWIRCLLSRCSDTPETISGPDAPTQ